MELSLVQSLNMSCKPENESVTLKLSIEDKSTFSNEEHPENSSAIEVTFEESNPFKFTSTSDEQPLNMQSIVVAPEELSPERSALVKFTAPLKRSLSEEPAFTPGSNTTDVIWSIASAQGHVPEGNVPDTPSVAQTVKAPEASSIHSQPSPKERNDAKATASELVLSSAELTDGCDAASCASRLSAYASVGAIPTANVSDSAQRNAAFPFTTLFLCMSALPFPFRNVRKQMHP